MEITAIDAGLICIICILLGATIVLLAKLGEVKMAVDAIYKTLKELKRELKNEIH